MPHFSLDIAPPSRQLDQLGTVDRVVKLDALCYAGLDDSGDLVGHIATMPPKLAGMPNLLPKRVPAGYATTVPAAVHGAADGDRTEPQRVRASRGKSGVELQEWRSWNERATEYADCYRHQLAALSQRAQPRWEVEKLTDAFGEGIHSGATHTVWLLEEGDFTIEGPGADLVGAELNPQPLPPKLVLRPRADVSVKDTSFEVHLRYAGSEEQLRFFIVPDEAPSTTVNRIGRLGEEL